MSRIESLWFPLRRRASVTVAVAALAVAGCSDDESPTDVEMPPPIAEVLTLREATAPGPAANARAGIQAAVDAFRSDLGDPNNGNAVGSQGPGRREVTWDGGDSDAAPARLPKDFYNAVAPRGLILGGDPRLQIMVSADASNPSSALPEFANVNATYSSAFAPFSSPRLFAPLNFTELEVTFRVPGTDSAGVVSGFGAVFTDVDAAGSASMTFLDAYDRELLSRQILATPGNESLSFLGATFDTAAVARVVIEVGSAPFGPNDVTQSAGNPDIVALDDFIYGEPAAVRD